MDKNREIEEMARDMCGFSGCLICSECSDDCQYYLFANRLYKKGYRKQEWISVEERLPKQSGKYLVCTKNGNVYQTKFYSYPERTGGHWGQKDKGKSITHWTNLPLPPKNN